MKRLLCLVFTALVYFTASCQYTADSAAITKLIEKEGLSWRNGDLNAYKDCWQATPKGPVFISTSNGMFIEMEPKSITNPSKEYFGTGGLAIHTNFKISIGGNKAWVSHDQIAIDKYGKSDKTKEIRFVENTNGKWKLTGQSIHQISSKTIEKDTTSYVHTVNISTGEIETIAKLNGHFEAPNWHPDNYLIINSYGKLYKLDIKTAVPNVLNTGFATACNNDHGISPDKKWLVVSHNDKTDSSSKPYKSAIFVLPIGGGEPRKVTSEVPSYWHGWSPDAKTLAYCAERNGNYDIYTIDINGGKEKRITREEGLDDGPEYSPDGKFIYFNSYRTGHMQIWRMLSDGSKPEQLTFDENSNWFAHPSPDNKWIVYIAYTSDEKQAHLFGKQVKLRLMNIATREIKDITPVFYGGQGTINVPSWSADSKKIAFVSYSVK